MQQAAACYQHGALEAAERCCAAALELQPESLDALRLLGIIAARTQRPHRAVLLFEKVVAAKPNDTEAYNNLGNVLKMLNRHQEAVRSYERCLVLEPNYSQAHYNLANLWRDLGCDSKALKSYDRALQINPAFLEVLANRGQVLRNMGRFEEALADFDNALDLKPSDLNILNNRGNLLRDMRRFEEALNCYRLAISLKPDSAEAHSNLGNGLLELDRFAEALASFDRALEIKPEYVDAHINRGVALQKLRRVHEALAAFGAALSRNPDNASALANRSLSLCSLRRFEEALADSERALAQQPNCVAAHINRGTTLQHVGRSEEALACYQRALQFEPKHAEALVGLGSAAQELGRIDEAFACYQQALEFSPDRQWLYGMWLYAKMQRCDWQDFDAQLARLSNKVNASVKACEPFAALVLADAPSTQRKAAEQWMADRCQVEDHLPPLVKKRPTGKIRLGYFSGDFYNHATAYLMAELIEIHDRTNFEVIGFSFGQHSDEMTRRLSGAFDRFVDLRAESNKSAASLARDLQIDIAVDLKGFTRESRPEIFAYRTAPIQVSYLGYPGTTASAHIDYLIADAVVIPEHSRPLYGEKIVYLPDCYQVNDRRREISLNPCSRHSLALPTDGFVFCCFNNSYKIAPRTFDIWMRILKRVPGSVLWLLEDNATAAMNLRREARTRGVAENRLVFARRISLPEHLARHRAADLFIDTLPCNAHTTASDALWAGLPVLTRTGVSMAARVASSLLNAVGLPELVADSDAHYEELAVAIATSPAKLAELKRKLHSNLATCPLFDTPRYVEHLEAAYRLMVARYHADLPPEHMAIARLPLAGGLQT